MKRQGNQAVIHTSNLSRIITAPQGDIPILLGVDLTVQAGEAVSVIGASGSGKSTLLGLLAGLDLPSGGEVSLLGKSLLQLDEDGRAALRAERVGFVFQAFHLLPGMTARDNVALPLELAGRPDAGERADALLQRVGLTERAGHYPNQLSGGEQQRVAIARAFVTEPEVLFADEPTGNLDAETGHHIIDMLFALREEQGTALVLVTHDPALASRCDRCYRLAGGHLELST
jgi:putative ABC transport system ATP-binding protein